MTTSVKVYLCLLYAVCGLATKIGRLVQVVPEDKTGPLSVDAGGLKEETNLQKRCDGLDIILWRKLESVFILLNLML